MIISYCKLCGKEYYTDSVVVANIELCTECRRESKAVSSNTFYLEEVVLITVKSKDKPINKYKVYDE